MVDETEHSKNHPRGTYRGCKHWRKMRKKGTVDVFFKKVCGICQKCRLYRDRELVGSALAEAQSTAFMLSLTLTYADIDQDGEKVAPPGAVRGDRKHLDTFCKSLTHAGYKFSKIANYEYGHENGRGHWHVLLFFKWSPELLRGWTNDFINSSNDHENERKEQWRSLGPPLHLMFTDAENGLPYAGEAKERFKERLDDPELLFVVEGYHSKGRNDIRNDWRFWPHGAVTGELSRSPDVLDKAVAQQAIRYTIKYVTKDVWKDTKAKGRPFDTLPEHMKQMTAYGPWIPLADRVVEKVPLYDDGSLIEEISSPHRGNKWVRRNEYAEKIRADYEARLMAGEVVPLEETPYLPITATMKNPGCFGEALFKAMAIKTARFEAESHMRRDYTLEGVYPRADEQKRYDKFMSGFAAPEKGGKLIQFYMSKTQWMLYGYAFNAERVRRGLEETQGKDFVFDNIETERARARNASGGSFAFHKWAKMSRSERNTFSDKLSYMSDKEIKFWTYPALHELLEKFDQRAGWPEKRRIRSQILTEGQVVKSADLSPLASIQITSLGAVIYLRRANASDAKEWWRREVKTSFQLDRALAEKLLPPDARSARQISETEAKPVLLSSLDPRTIVGRIERATGRDMDKPSVIWLRADRKEPYIKRFGEALP